MKRPIRVLLSLAATAALLGAMAGSATARSTGGAEAAASGSFSAMDIYRGRGSVTANVSSSNNLTYHGGPIQTGTPRVYISYWGSAWNSGFSSGGYTSGQAKTYVNDFFGGVGGTKWNNIVTQYCSGTTVGSQTCSNGSILVTNPSGELGGAYVDTTAVPRKPNQTDILNAAKRAAQHFGFGTNGANATANVTFMVFTPTHQSMSGFGSSWCAWHSSSGTLAYAYIPYMPDATWKCGQNFINSTNNSYGNGYFDGFSIVAGHEYSEAETDPLPNTGWLDSGGSENADKCAWQSSSGNISFSGHNYAVQSTWSNNIAGCPQVPTGL